MGSGLTYELHRFDPQIKLDAIKRASALVWPTLYLSLRDESIIVDDLLADTGYESTISAGAFPSWTNVGAGLTVTAETTRVFRGTQSAKLVEGGTGVAYMYQRPTVNVIDLVGKTVTFGRMCWASAASTARLRLDVDGSDITDGSYHAGDSAWHLLKVSRTIPSTATKIEARCEVAQSGTCYYDDGGDCGLFIDTVNKYTIPTSMLRGPHRVEQQLYAERPDGPYGVIQDGQPPVRGRILRLHGMGLLSQPSTETGTIEIGAPRTELFTAEAARFFYKATLSQGTAKQREWLGMLAQDWDKEIERLQVRPGMRMLAPGTEIPRNTWAVEEDSNGRYLYFHTR